MKRILCIWLPNWPVQRLVVAQPELKSKTIVLYAREPRRGQQVVYCSRGAVVQGIWPDMSLAEVAAVMRKSNLRRKQMHFVAHDPRLDLEALQQIATWCEQFTPCLGLESTAEPSSLLLDVTASAPRLGGEARLVDDIQQVFRRRGYLVAVAVAETLSAAWAVAHFGCCVEQYEFRYAHRSPSECSPSECSPSECSPSECSPSELNLADSPHADANLVGPPTHDMQALVGHDQCGSYLVPPGQLATALQRLPIESLRLEDRSVDLLHQLGVRDISQLWELPRAGLRARFGENLLKRIDQAVGQTTETFTAYRAPLPLTAAISLEHATTCRAVLEDCLRQLLAELCQRLRDQNRGAIRITCEWLFVDRSTTTFSVGFYRPSNELAHLDSLMRMQLEQRTIPSPVERIELQIALSASLEHHQHGLLGDSSHSAPQQLAYLIDRLSSRLGRDTVLGARLRCEPQPERAFDYQPLTGQQTTPRKSTSAATTRHQVGSGLRPLHMVDRSLRIHIPPARPSRLPKSFGYQGRTYSIQYSAGPERIETGWWRGRIIRRDYYQVEDTQGNRFWIFCDLNRQEWFLQGCF